MASSPRGLFAPFATVALAAVLAPAMAAPFPSTPTSAARAVQTTDAEMAPLSDPPSRVGRVARVQAGIGYRAPGEVQWSAAGVNLPVTAGAALLVETGGRVLLELPGATLSLEGGSAVELVELDDSALRVSLGQGTLGLDVTELQPGDVLEVSTPHGHARILKPGRYLVDAGDAELPARLVVYRGQAEFAGPLGMVLRAGTGQAVVAGNELALEPAGPPSPLLAWAVAGDKVAPHPASVAAMPGGAMLSRFGRWATHPEYGDVWRPEVDAGWSPFSQGHWRDVQPWGWSWVDDAPWGFAPAHYGRWYQDAGAWWWAPRPFARTGGPRWPVYAPAVVRFAGGGGRPVGWAPLAPREAFFPGPRFSPRYLRQVNLSAVPGGFGGRPLPGEFSRLTNARGTVMVPAMVMQRSQPVAPHILRGPGALADIGPERLPARLPGGFAGRSFGAPPAAPAPRGMLPPDTGSAPPQALAARPPGVAWPPRGFTARPPDVGSPPQNFARPVPPQGFGLPGYQAPRADRRPAAGFASPPSAPAPGYGAPPRSYTPPESFATGGYGGQQRPAPMASYAPQPRAYAPQIAAAPRYAPPSQPPRAFAPQPGYQAPRPVPQAFAAPRNAPSAAPWRPSFGGHRR